MSHFTVVCRECGTGYNVMNGSPDLHCGDALPVTVYRDEDFMTNGGDGIWKYNWLPVHAPAFSQPGPVVYRSEGFAAHLGLEELYVAFNGYWPEKGALIETCTFKEYEAAVVLQNALERGAGSLIVASAGNTAKAVTHLAGLTGFPVVVIVPSMCLSDMWYLEPSLAIPTVAVGDGDYADSIDVAKRISSTMGIPFDGGIYNIAKRDGLGIVLLEALPVMGRLPDHYFQAVGSGAGAIALWEMSERCRKKGIYASRLPVLHLAQNLPFAPMVRAWQKGSRHIDRDDLRTDLIDRITTRVLSNRYPAYSVCGGVYDALTATGGMMYGVENDDVYSAMALFEESEGVDIVPAAGVAVAALKEAVHKGAVSQRETILLNITGGGEKRLRREKKTHRVESIVISKSITEEEIKALWHDTLKMNS